MTVFKLGALRGMANSRIDQAAAEARQRHITGMAGQDMVYAEKLAQARAYLVDQAADAGAPVPGYVAAEVSAAGGTAVAAAQAIVDAAAAFHQGPGPEIELARRSGKLAVQAGDTAEAVAAARDEALQALQAI